MSPWDKEREHMIIHSLIVAHSPLRYLLGLGVLGILGGLYLWLSAVSNTSPKPKQLQTATDYAEWGYQVMNADMPEVARINPARRQANCKTALHYFDKAISLNPKLTIGYQGRGMSLICQNYKQAGRKELFRAKKLYLEQGNKQQADAIDLILQIHK